MPLPVKSTILGRVLAALETVAWTDELAIPKFTLRHGRNRASRADEQPCLSIFYVETERNPDAFLHNADEACWRMNIDLVIDAKIATERSEDDPTGLALLDKIASLASAALCAPDGLLRQLVDDVGDSGDRADEDSTPDEARLVVQIFVLYRTLQDDRGHLLTPEENP